jgi:Zn-dependent protease
VISGLALVATQRYAPGAEPLRLVFSCGLQANCLLAVLNLLPVPPFDGWSVVRFALPGLRQIRADRLYLASWVLVTVLLVTPASQLIYGVAGVLAGLIGTAAQALIH